MSQDNSRNWLWKTTTTRQFSYASAWHIVRSPSPLFSLHIVVWFLCHNPKMACCLLRALHDRLLTANRFKSFSIINQDMCALCCEGSETIHICFLMSLCYYIWTLCKLSCVLLLQPPLCMKKLRLSRTVSTRKARIMLQQGWYWQELYGVCGKKKIGVFQLQEENKIMISRRLYEDINLVLQTCHQKTSSDNREKEILSNWSQEGYCIDQQCWRFYQL